MSSFPRMGRAARAAAAALLRDSAAAIVPRVVADAAAGDASERESVDLRARLTAFLERRISPWCDALEADDGQRHDAIIRLLQTDAAAAEHIPPVVLLGTVAIGHRIIEAEVRARADSYGYPPDVIWAEIDLLRRTIVEKRRASSDGSHVA